MIMHHTGSVSIERKVEKRSFGRRMDFRAVFFCVFFDSVSLGFCHITVNN